MPQYLWSEQRFSFEKAARCRNVAGIGAPFSSWRAVLGWGWRGCCRCRWCSRPTQATWGSSACYPPGWEAPEHHISVMRDFSGAVFPIQSSIFAPSQLQCGQSGKRLGGSKNLGRPMLAVSLASLVFRQTGCGSVPEVGGFVGLVPSSSGDTPRCCAPAPPAGVAAMVPQPRQTAQCR